MEYLGRPTKYKPRYCKDLVKFMSEGYSYQAFAAKIDVHIDTLYEWEKRHPAFSEAKNLAYAKNREFWEKVGIDGALGKIKGFSAASYIFNMKNRFQWADRVEKIEDTRLSTVRIELPGQNQEQVISLEPSQVRENPPHATYENVTIEEGETKTTKEYRQIAVQGFRDEKTKAKSEKKVSKSKAKKTTKKKAKKK